jgi:hypothetical protein
MVAESMYEESIHHWAERGRRSCQSASSSGDKPNPRLVFIILQWYRQSPPPPPPPPPILSLANFFFSSLKTLRHPIFWRNHFDPDTVFMWFFSAYIYIHRVDHGNHFISACTSKWSVYLRVKLTLNNAEMLALNAIWAIQTEHDHAILGEASDSDTFYHWFIDRWWYTNYTIGGWVKESNHWTEQYWGMDGKFKSRYNWGVHGRWMVAQQSHVWYDERFLSTLGLGWVG